MRLRLILLLALTLLVGIDAVSAQTESTVSAQANTPPLLAMLARIPDAPSAHDFLTYIDYPALFAARPGAPIVHSWAEFNIALSTKDAASALLRSALNGIHSGPDFFPLYFMRAVDSPKVVGFDDFAIQQGVQYGNPPDQVVLLAGAFDAQAIISAHEQRGYTQSQTDGLTLLCPQAGCDQGNKLDMSNINPANPFGGSLGRSQPVVVGDNLVVSSPSIDAVNLTASTIAGKTPSLADQADYHAAAEAITSNGTLLQAYFIPPAMIGSAAQASIAASVGASPTQSAQIFNAMSTEQANFVPIPAYNLVALADAATKDEELALVAIVYANQADAQTAAALFPDRIEKYVSLKTKQTMGDLFTQRGVTSIDVSVFTASTNRSVLLLTLHAPLPSPTIAEGQTLPRSMSLGYSALVQAYTSRDLGWLATQF